jgi:hypothetical protein
VKTTRGAEGSFVKKRLMTTLAIGALVGAMIAASVTSVFASGRPIAGCPPGFLDHAYTLTEALEYKGSIPPGATAYFGGYFAKTDKNGDGLVCMKDLPNTPGIPSFATQLMDNVASA